MEFHFIISYTFICQKFAEVKHLYLTIALTCFIVYGFCQQPATISNELLLRNFYNGYTAPAKRKILSIKDKSILSKINPVTYLSAGLLFVYQRTFSDQIQADCMYEISCSSYTKFQIEKNGFRGFLLGINQLNNCVPAISKDYPDYKKSSEGKIINTVVKIKNE